MQALELWEIHAWDGGDRQNPTGKFYGHYLDTVTDATFVVDEEDGDGERVFEVSADCYVTKQGEALGKFVTRIDGHWGFIAHGGKQMWSPNTIHQAEGLLQAERWAFKQLLEAA